MTAPAIAAGELAPRLKFDNVDLAKAYLKAQGVTYVLAKRVDIHGVAKAKSVPLAHLNPVLADGAGFAPAAARSTSRPKTPFSHSAENPPGALAD